MQYLITFCGPGTPPKIRKLLHSLKDLQSPLQTLVIHTGAGEESTAEMNRQNMIKQKGANPSQNTLVAYAGGNTELLGNLGCYTIDMENSLPHDERFRNYFKNFLQGTFYK